MMASETTKPQIVPPRRWKNGHKARKKTTIEQLVEFEKEKMRVEKQTALSQPGRKGFDDPENPWLGSALGRFCFTHKLREEIFRAGEHYAQTRRAWLSAVGAPMSVRLGGSGADTPLEIVRRWKSEVDAMEDAILVSSIEGIAVLGWIGEITMFESDPPPYILPKYLISGFMALAVACGYIDPREMSQNRS